MDIFLLGNTYTLTAQFFTGALFGVGLFIVLRALFENYLVVHLRTKYKACKVVRNKLFTDVTDLHLKKITLNNKIDALQKQLAFAEKNNEELGDTIYQLSKEKEALYIEKDKLAVKVNKLSNGVFSKKVINKEGRIEAGGN